MAQFVFNAVKRYLPVILWILLAGPSEAGAQSFLQQPSMRLHHLQGSLMAGAARLAKNGDHGTGYSFVLKEQYHFTGVLYSSVGVGLTYVQGQHLYPPEKEPLHYHSSYLSLPIGGGIIHVPAMVQWLQFPVYIATATSHFILAIMSTISVLVHLFHGNYNHAEVQHLMLGLAIGVIPGAQLGARLSHRVSTLMIIKVLAICLALVGLRVLWNGIR